ncbi:MAG: AraC family transcriptional regulator [Prevotella sp.]|nr:AraC family transcriptional regulator [Prevotella sp.]
MTVSAIVHACAFALMLVVIVRLIVRVKALKAANTSLYEKSLERLDIEKGEQAQREWYEQQIAHYSDQLERLRSQVESLRQALLQTEAAQAAAAVPLEAGEDVPPAKGRAGGLDDDAKAMLALEISRVMETDDVIYSPSFGLTQLCDMVGSNSKYVSQTINQIFKKNFPTLLNEHRIREACRRIIDAEHYGHLTIEGIAEGVGFKSRTNFIATFKKIVGLSPSEYKKIAQNQQ